MVPPSVPARGRYAGEEGGPHRASGGEQEWVYAYVYQAARARADAELAARVADAYLDHIDDAFGYFETRSREVVGREMPQVLLLHANRLNADLLEPLLARVRARGYRFVELAEAMEDPVYAREDPYVGRGGPSWIERWGVAAGAAPVGGRCVRALEDLALTAVWRCTRHR